MKYRCKQWFFTLKRSDSIRKLYIVRTTRDFDDIIKNGKSIKNKCFVIHYKDNNLPYDRFGISVSKKLGNAVFRNKYKRKIRTIVDNYKKEYLNNKDYIIILRKEALSRNFKELNKDFLELMPKNKKGI
ncbi:MAG: ribonuclease P protein component [Bacilli bacterium]|nr:ribonuclease P protein component [Bacilli bacterium]MBQ6404628.1 ribonuclease P protein component [Bacilli bacterium]